MSATLPEGKTSRMWVKCGPCEHVWVAAYLPMPMAKAARAIKRAYCPVCGELKKIFIATAADVAKAEAT